MTGHPSIGDCQELELAAGAFAAGVYAHLPQCTALADRFPHIALFSAIASYGAIGLGLKAEAVRLARRAVALSPTDSHRVLLQAAFRLPDGQ